MHFSSFHKISPADKRSRINSWGWFAWLILLTIACRKENEPTRNAIVSNTCHLNISSKNKAVDSAAIDVDKDGIKDISVIAVNTQLFSYIFYPTYHAIYVNALQNNIEFISDGVPYPDCLAGTYCFRFLRNISKGIFINSALFNMQNTIRINATCSVYYINAPLTGSKGYFDNTSGYAGMRMKKPDGYHYGWVSLSNANQCMDATVTGSAYESVVNTAIEIY